MKSKIDSSASCRVAVVGAGVSGLQCSRDLLSRLSSLRDETAPSLKTSFHVSLFEWGRGPGGRTARRRVKVEGEEGAVGELSFDHAAPFFQTETGTGSIRPLSMPCPSPQSIESAQPGTDEEQARQLLREWESSGWVEKWKPVELEAEWEEGGEGHGNRNVGKDLAGQQSSVSTETDYWVGVPSMNSICKGLAAEVQKAAEVEEYFGCHVLSVEGEESVQKWKVTWRERGAKEGEEKFEFFDAAVLSDKLLIQDNKYGVLPKSYEGPLSAARELKSTTVSVLLTAFPCGSLPAFGILRPRGHPVIEKVVCDTEKPHRAKKGGPVCLVVHSTEAFAKRHLEGDWFRDEETAREEMERGLREVLKKFFPPEGVVSSPVVPVERESDADPKAERGEGSSDTDGTFPLPLVSIAHMWDCAQVARPETGTTMQSSGKGYLLDSAQGNTGGTIFLGACGDFCASSSWRGEVLGAALSGRKLAAALFDRFRKAHTACLTQT
uniref:Amine oxidase domain-containing protein n=1 Tax=Chromera velia CCMP2878 TaxID=1169474 RepID=A0A0G4HMM0_9ALVE|eukprot:Cvel_7522.t1-p1 / transcript=Cvel_7522.t1 / gene=Cvel_7522 / organism=Chromera_velia_CCMP2878 / gene_product=hypothetical protein / transcript_product=hypothetical protein / location=Cvel_scaffold395:34218-37524(-) / protein_length=493 / sequence_SO=supercontig / SO=protein_coding / is_pseudo=false